MADKITEIRTIQITDVSGGDVNADEAANNFTISGTGTYKDDKLTATTISITVKWSDGANPPNTLPSEIFSATITSVDHGKRTFKWAFTVNDFSDPGHHPGFIVDSVEVIFPKNVNNTKNTTSGTGPSDTDSDFSFACFLRGTRVLTRHGYCPVEELAVGDEVRTLSGGWQPLRWIGHQRITTPFGLAKGAPVRITAGAFGPALPERDVCVSQDHAVFFRNQLIPARFLVNGVTVFRDTSVKDIEYFHLLLDRHAVVFSEGLATESYVPCENIDWFDNTAECPQALLNAIRAGTADCLIECYPRKTTGPAVEAARALLARFAPADTKERAVG
jgi:hypothetical protein